MIFYFIAVFYDIRDLWIIYRFQLLLLLIFNLAYVWSMVESTEFRAMWVTLSYTALLGVPP